jgi:hypothetical protein
MADLITVEQLEARLKQEFTGTALTQVQGLIADASALVRLVARTDFATSVPATIVTVVAQMVRRALENPEERTGENIGAYGYQAMGQLTASSGGAIYVTRAERRIIREAAGRPAVIGISGDTGLLDPLSSDTEPIV